MDQEEMDRKLNDMNVKWKVEKVDRIEDLCKYLYISGHKVLRSKADLCLFTVTNFLQALQYESPHCNACLFLMMLIIFKKMSYTLYK